MPEPFSSARLTLTEAEITYYLSRCPSEHRWAFGPYLRGERDLAGDVITTHPQAGPVSTELWRVQLWLDKHLVEEHIACAPLAEQYANVIRLRIRGLPGRRLYCERVEVDSTFLGRFSD